MPNQKFIILLAILSGWLMAGACSSPGAPHIADKQVVAGTGGEQIQVHNTTDTAILNIKLQKGFLLHTAGNYPAAIACYETVLPEYRRAGFTEISAVISYNLFQCYWQEKDFAKARLYLAQFKSDLK